MTAAARLIEGDCRQVLPTLAAESIQTVITSPPYLWLRDYGVPGQIGLEHTVDEYLDTIITVFREVRRVLRNDGTLWLNLGDLYNNNSYIRPSSHQPSLNGYEDTSWGYHAANGHARLKLPKGDHKLKHKDLIGLPWLVAFALRADGWYLRSDIVWSKNNPMPESVKDRPTRSHEYLFLFSKRARYYYDRLAIAEPVSERTRPRGHGQNPKAKTPAGWNTGDGGHDTIEGRYPGNERWRVKQDASFAAATTGHQTLRNKRTVWQIPPQPYPGAHYATFPEELVAPCILAGTSERGACPACATPWRRLTEVQYLNPGNRTTNGPRSAQHKREQVTSAGSDQRLLRDAVTIGWEPSCTCDAGDPVACQVLDPFAGTGTVGEVALRLGRSFTGIELHPDYVRQAEQRILSDCPMFNSVSVERFAASDEQP